MDDVEQAGKVPWNEHCIGSLVARASRFFLALLVWLAIPVCAQQTEPAADRMAPATRAAEIESARQQKAAHLEPDEPNRIEQVLNYVEDHKIVERITCGVTGLCVRFGGLITGSGFALGPEYINRDLLHGNAIYYASVRGSLAKFYRMDTGLELPRLYGGHVFSGLEAVHLDYPHIDYYGPGPNSSRSGRTDYALEQTWVQGNAGVSPFDRLRIGGVARYLLNNVSRGHDDQFASTDQVFTEATTPGIQFQTNYVVTGGFVQYDWRDYPGEPRRGGNYVAQYSLFTDVEREHYSFDRLDLNAQQYVSFFNQRRVIALRGRVQAAQPHTGNQVPFYLQPTLGGPDDLRGFRPFRFYGDASLLLTGEYRWEVFSGLDMALFVDSGRVYNDWHDISLNQMQTDAGFGFRFNVRNDVFLRIDTGFSREGFQVWLRFGNVF
jgi:Omp85 superfamily domain